MFDTDGETVIETAEATAPPVAINSFAVIKSIRKDYPTFFTSWQSNWGEAPADAGEYNYLLWNIATNIDAHACQPYDLSFEDVVDWGEPFLYRFTGQGYTTDPVITNQTMTGVRNDAVITRHSKTEWETKDRWEIPNTITATLHPADDLDPDTSAKSSNIFRWKRPSFEAPEGKFAVYKRADQYYREYKNYHGYGVSELTDLGNRAGEYSRYDLDKLVSGEIDEITGLDYAVWSSGNQYIYTLKDGGDEMNPEDYGVNKVKWTLTDNRLYAYPDVEYTENEKDFSRQLTAEDYDIQSLAFRVLVNDAVINEATGEFESGPGTYTEDDVLKIYVEYGGQWYHAATFDYFNDTIWYDEAYVLGMSTNSVGFVENVTGYRLETENRHYHVDLQAVPSIRIKNSEYIMSLAEDQTSIAVCNIQDTVVEDHNGNVIFQGEHDNDDYIRRVQRDSYLDKQAVASNTNAKKKLYTITWEINMHETITIETGDVLPVEQSSGTFYDLLPEGGVFDPSSLQVKLDGATVSDISYSIEMYPNYFDSGKTLLEIDIPGAAEEYTILYNTTHSWDSVKDWGKQVYNPVAYRTGNYDIAGGSDDDGGNIEAADLMSDLTMDDDGNKFIYAETKTDILAITTSIAGLSKKVRNHTDDVSYSYDTIVVSSAPYTYQIRMENSYTIQAKNIVFFDSLENYYADRNSDWKGTIADFDLNNLKRAGIAPVVYLSDVENLNLDEHHDLSDTSIWHRMDSYEVYLSDAKAFAIDATKKEDGTDFILDKGASISCYVNMMAPAEATRKDASGQPETGIPETYNNIYMAETVIDGEGLEQDFFVHQDYDTVRFYIVGGFTLNKVNKDNPSEKISGVSFRLFGTSMYGTNYDETKKTNRNGQISWSGIEAGTYSLQEVSAPEDWLVDYEDHLLTIGTDGKTYIDGEEITSAGWTVTNKPRVHGDLEILKLSSVSNAPVEGVTFRLSGHSFYGNDVMQTRTTTRTGRASFLNVERGEYKLKEIKTNENFILDEREWDVVVDGNGTVTVRNGELDDGYYHFYNTPRYWSFYLRKVDAENPSIYLQGAEFTLHGTSDLGTSYNMTVLSDKDGRVDFEKIEAGTYVLKEIKAPQNVDEDGHTGTGGTRSYINDEKQYVVTISREGEILIDGLERNTYGDFVVENARRLDGEITIIKKWDDGGATDRPTPTIRLTTEEHAPERGIILTKIWKNDSPLTRPHDVTAHLMKQTGENSYEEVAVTKEARWIKDEYRWQYVFDIALDTEAEYYIYEDPIPDYTTSASAEKMAHVVDNAVTVTNSHDRNSALENFEYSGEVETYTAPYTGEYKLQVWGAQAADTYYRDDESQPYYGGKGGYSEGTIHLNRGEKLYIAVGGVGGIAYSERTRPAEDHIGLGGWNGGGNAYASLNSTMLYRCAAGGGATSITTANRGELKAFADHQDEVVIVAGGGGGGSADGGAFYNCSSGAAGGGLEGENRGHNDWKAAYGTQDGVMYDDIYAGFGYGANADEWYSKLKIYLIPGGGGGWYGGGLCHRVQGGTVTQNIRDMKSSGGGSGYIGGVENGVTVAGNVRNGIVEPDGTTATGHTGAGHARITYIPAPGEDIVIPDDGGIERGETPVTTVEYITEDSKWQQVDANTWKYTFNVFDDSLKYYLTEDELSGYMSDLPGGYMIVNGDALTRTATVTNSKEQSHGSLKITKTVTGTTTDKAFAFTITLSGEGISGTQIFDGVPFIDGVAKISLKHGETKFIDGLPSGVSYVVTEDPQTEYSTTSVNAEGTITTNTEIAVSFVNDYIPQEEETRDVTLEKTVDGIEAEETDYHFLASFKGLTPGKTYTTSTELTFTADANGEVDVDVYLKKDEQLVFYRLPLNAKYQFMEYGGNYIASYEASDQNETGSIVSYSSMNTEKGVDLTTAEETVDSGEDVKIRFTNQVESTQNITLMKIVEGQRTSGRYPFKIVFNGLAENARYNTSVGYLTSDRTGHAELEFTLPHNGTVEFQGIPIGATYQITEQANRMKPKYVVEDISGSADKHIASESGEAADANTELSTGVETVDPFEAIVVTFTNISLDTYSDLTIQKTVTGNMGSKDHYFKVTATFTDGIPNMSVPVDLSNASSQTDFNTKDKLIHINPSSVMFDAEGNATVEFYIRHNETIVLEGLRTGTQCVITEDAEDYNANSTLLSSEGSSILGQSTTETIEFPLEESTTLRIVNTKTATIPTGVWIKTSAEIILAILGILSLIANRYIFRRKHNNV